MKRTKKLARRRYFFKKHLDVSYKVYTFAPHFKTK